MTAMSIQTCGSSNPAEDDFSFSMCFGDGPVMTFEGLTRAQIRDLRDCLDCMLWEESESDYPETLDQIRATIGPYVSVMDEKEASKEVLETIRELLLRKVDFDNGNNPDGSLHWPDVESMLTRPLDFQP